MMRDSSLHAHESGLKSLAFEVAQRQHNNRPERNYVREQRGFSCILFNLSR